VLEVQKNGKPDPGQQVISPVNLRDSQKKKPKEEAIVLEMDVVHNEQARVQDRHKHQQPPTMGLHRGGQPVAFKKRVRHSGPGEGRRRRRRDQPKDGEDQDQVSDDDCEVLVIGGEDAVIGFLGDLEHIGVEKGGSQ